MSLVLWLGDADADVDLVGGKAASLTRLARMGLPTPDGFVVRAGAFGEYLRSAGAEDQARELVEALPDPGAEARLETLAHEHALPEPLASELAAATVRIAGEDAGRRLVARSSARSEDCATSSFAGQHETILDVEPQDVEHAVRQCWASLWSGRAVAYCRAQELPVPGPDEMAVLVQPLVDAVASAVLFTVNPVSGDREEVVVDAARGLGEQIVSGAVTADNIVLDRVTLAPLRVGSGGNGDARANGHSEPAVTLDEAAGLAELCLRAERGFGTPLDVEAAHDGERWWLLQARPITTVAAAGPAASGDHEQDELLVGAAAGQGNGG